MAEPLLALQVMTMPRDTNHTGTVFGGVILSLIDQAAYVHARGVGLHRWVTVAVDRVEFIAPVYVGELVTFHTTTERSGKTSLTVRVVTTAQRYSTGERVRVTDALVVMVAVDEQRNPIPHGSAPTLPPDGGDVPMKRKSL
ncbi:MAG: acyl-CoA thioesterase [Phycisphaerales bacterium]|nr:acyl-CoA thioesterase [Phycisphaerales bacterium]